MNIHMYISVYACVCVCIYICMCAYIYIVKIRLCFPCFLPKLVSHLALRVILLNFTLWFARSWHFYMARFITDPTLFSCVMPSFISLWTLAASGSMHWQRKHCLVPQCIRHSAIRQMLSCPSPIAYDPPLKCSLPISSQTSWLIWRASNMKISGFALCLWWLVDFSHSSLVCLETQDMASPSKLQKPKRQQTHLGISLKRKNESLH